MQYFGGKAKIAKELSKELQSRLKEGQAFVDLFCGSCNVVSRIIWTILHGNIPKGMIIDHLDGNPWNNRPSNLVCKTRAENIRNCAKRKDNTSGVVGVRFIVQDGYTFCVGTYQDVNKKRKTAHFSVTKYGLLPAFKMAVEFRLNGIKKMNELHNFKYTDKHIGVGI